jgi:inosose dehydratase
MTAIPPALADRIAAAPISWGVCEVPGWGLQLPPPRVLAEMRAVGLRATELGPDGYLPGDPAALKAQLDRFGLRPVAGFVPVVLHRPDLAAEQLDTARRGAALLAAAGAEVLVVAAATGDDGYEARPELDRAGWDHLVAMLDRVAEVAGEHGLALALHPHVGTVVERGDDLAVVLERSGVQLCVDTGHLLIGGADPLALVREAPERVRHVHLKDVDLDLARRVGRGDLGYTAAVRAGIYRPLGAGDVPIAEVVATLERSGYRHWYVLEQDVAIDTVPEEGAGPVLDVRASLAFLDVQAAVSWRPAQSEPPEETRDRTVAQRQARRT